MPPRGEENVPHATLNTLFEKLGEAIAVSREAKHAANNASQKIDVIGGKVDSLALVVATQGQIREHVERVESAQAMDHAELELLKADKLRREGALGLVEWLTRNWPLTLVLTGLAVLIAWVNGRIGL